MNDKIIIKGARENNLKNINIELPKNKLIVMTGLSGSGKSSLAFDTIYQEGQRRFVESLSSFARQFIGGNEKPDVDSIEGLSPAISIDQKSASHNPRSTVGTVTEIYDYLRVLFSRVGTPYCPTHKIPISSLTIDQIVDKIMTRPLGSKLYITAPVIFRQKGEHKGVFEKYLKAGYVRALVDGKMVELEDEIPSLERTKKHNIYIVLERMVMKEGVRSRIFDAVELATKESNGYCVLYCDDKEEFFSTKHACPECGYSLASLEPRIFSFNSPLGACPECNGLGKKLSISEGLVVDEDKSLNKGAIVAYKNWDKDNLTVNELHQTCAFYKIDKDKPFKDLTDKQKKMILYGSDDEIEFSLTATSGRNHDKKAKFEGVITNFERRYRETTSEWIREWLEGFMVECQCDVCLGKRLNPSILNIFIQDKNIADVCSMSIEECYSWFGSLKLSPEKTEISKLAIKEIRDRLHFLMNVGLEYLTLARSADTLSGGEAQRIRLATQIGSQLTGVLYVLDEPSIGLHQKDNAKLIKTLKEMRDLGNTLIVVEHDDETMKESDWLVDIGPRAGIHGGEVIAFGTPEEVMQNTNSITGNYLSGRMKIEVPAKRRDYKSFIQIKGAKQNNLKNVNVSIPKSVLTVVTGVSGSGKSSLVNEVLYKNAYIKLYKSKKITPGLVDKIEGLEDFDRIIQISQQPIGKTPRSNPATYTGVFDDIRELFSQTTDAKIKNYDKGKFSFNVKGGRCEACGGDGVKRISMQFLPDVYVPCEVCKGKRYTSETLEIRFKGKNIADVLDMTIEDALEFFDAFPKIKNKLKALVDVGLGYMKVGQSSTTLSGGEAQRVKLATELQSKISSKTLYIMDEPTTGLHVDDIKRLMEVIGRIADLGATVIIIEHNLDVIKLADYIVDMGPNGGDMGGTVVFQGRPEDLAKHPTSYTGEYLRPLLK